MVSNVYPINKSSKTYLIDEKCQVAYQKSEYQNVRISENLNSHQTEISCLLKYKLYACKNSVIILIAAFYHNLLLTKLLRISSCEKNSKMHICFWKCGNGGFKWNPSIICHISAYKEAPVDDYSHIQCTFFIKKISWSSTETFLTFCGFQYQNFLRLS